MLIHGVGHNFGKTGSDPKSKEISIIDHVPVPKQVKCPPLASSDIFSSDVFGLNPNQKFTYAERSKSEPKIQRCREVKTKNNNRFEGLNL